jgi:copper chaperone
MEATMATIYSVPDMSCGHCAAAIEKAVRGVDDMAEVRCDLAGKSVVIETTAGTEAVMAALAAEGYPAAPQR